MVIITLTASVIGVITIISIIGLITIICINSLITIISVIGLATFITISYMGLDMIMTITYYIWILIYYRYYQ